MIVIQFGEWLIIVVKINTLHLLRHVSLDVKCPNATANKANVFTEFRDFYAPATFVLPAKHC